MNIFHYSQIKYLGKVSIFWCFREEFLHFDEKFQLYLRILMKITNYLVDYIVYASLLGKSLFLAFGKGFLGFCKIFTSEHRCTVWAHDHTVEYPKKRGDNIHFVQQGLGIGQNLTTLNNFIERNGHKDTVIEYLKVCKGCVRFLYSFLFH